MPARFHIDKEKSKVFIVLANFPEMTNRFNKTLRLALYNAGVEINRETVRLITSPPKTGRFYKYAGLWHQASAPGEAPANRSGNLVRSNYYKVQSSTRLEVGEKAKYAGFLEDGTSKMAPRPHILKSIENKRRDIIRFIDQAIDKALPK